MEPLLYIDSALPLVSEIIETDNDSPVNIALIDVPSNSTIFLELTVVALRYDSSACLFATRLLQYLCGSDGILTNIYDFDKYNQSQMSASYSLNIDDINVLKIVAQGEPDAINKWRTSTKITIVNTDPIPK